MNELETLKTEVRELKEWKRQMSASHSIPLANDQAFRGRFFQDLIITEPISDITPADRDQTTSAGGGDLVPQVPTGLIKAKANGIIIYVPYYQ